MKYTEGFLTRAYLRLCSWNLHGFKKDVRFTEKGASASSDNALLEIAAAMSLVFWVILMFAGILYARLAGVSTSAVTLLTMPYRRVAVIILLPSFITFFILLRVLFRATIANLSLLDKYNSTADRVKLVIGIAAFGALFVGGLILVGILER
jgi:hypothetical protein